MAAVDAYMNQPRKHKRVRMSRKLKPIHAAFKTKEVRGKGQIATLSREVAFSSSLRADGLVLLFILPLTVGLFVASRKRVLHADSIMFFVLTMLLLGPLLLAFSDHHNVPYRFVPLIVFFAMGVGVLLSKRD